MENGWIIMLIDRAAIGGDAIVFHRVYSIKFNTYLGSIYY